jgi:hypothetical protein
MMTHSFRIPRLLRDAAAPRVRRATVNRPLGVLACDSSGSNSRCVFSAANHRCFVHRGRLHVMAEAIEHKVIIVGK